MEGKCCVLLSLPSFFMEAVDGSAFEGPLLFVAHFILKAIGHLSTCTSMIEGTTMFLLLLLAHRTGVGAETSNSQIKVSPAIFATLVKHAAWLFASVQWN